MVLAHWGLLSFRELDQHTAAAYLSGVLIRHCSYIFSPLILLLFSYALAVFVSLYCMGTRALFFTFLFPLWRIAFQVIVELVLLFWSVCGAHTAHLFLSTIRVLHLHPHTLVLLVLVGSAIIIIIFLFACAALGVFSHLHLNLTRRIDLPRKLHSLI